MLLTDDDVIAAIDSCKQDVEKEFLVELARAIESAVLEKLKAQEPYVIEYPEYHQQGMGCGLEDRNITDRYEAMAYGWDCAIDAMAECIPDRLYEHPLPPADVVQKYEELLYAVHKKFPDETRHQTALRYIKTAESPSYTNASMKEMK
jgi:hypothetical protein